MFDEEGLFRHRIAPSGVTYAEDFEEIEAAHGDNLSYWDFLEKPVWYKGLVLAHYAGKHQIRAVLDEEQRMIEERERAKREALNMSGVR